MIAQIIKKTNTHCFIFFIKSYCDTVWRNTQMRGWTEGYIIGAYNVYYLTGVITAEEKEAIHEFFRQAIALLWK